MIAAVDVHYVGTRAFVGCIQFDSWRDEQPRGETSLSITVRADYIPGRFYLRELPCLLAVIERLDAPPEAIVIDGYVWLADGRPGLGRHLYNALGGGISVIGVAKNAFADNDAAVPVQRGRSVRPLYVTASGIEAISAAELVLGMSGPHRLPTLLKRVDRLCREVASSAE